MGQDQADNFYQLVRRASLATRSAAAADRGDDIMVRRKNEAVMKVLGANTDQPQEVLRTLRALQQAMRYQDPTVVTPVIRDSGPFLSMPLTQYARQSDEETWH